MSLHPPIHHPFIHPCIYLLFHEPVLGAWLLCYVLQCQTLKAGPGSFLSLVVSSQSTGWGVLQTTEIVNPLLELEEDSRMNYAA